MSDSYWHTRAGQEHRDQQLRRRVALEALLGKKSEAAAATEPLTPQTGGTSPQGGKHG